MGVLMKKLIPFFALFCIAFFETGCIQLDINGNYYGVLNTINSKKNNESFIVKVDINNEDKNNILIKITSKDKKVIPIKNEYQLSLSGFTQSTVTLKGIDSETNSTELVLSEKDNCLHGKDLKIILCYNEEAFDFQIQDEKLTPFHLSAKRNYHENDIPGFKGKNNFYIEELLAITSEKSFDTRIEYQKVIEARKNAEANYLALAPRLTISSIGAILSGGGIGNLIGVLGDLTPFLFPSNWLKSKETNIQADAEKITLQILKLDTQLQVEALANMILRDEEVLGYYDAMIKYAQFLHDSIEIRENLGQYPIGSTDNIQSILNNLVSDKNEIAKNIIIQKGNLSVLVGFSNPEKIKTISWKKEPSSIAHPISVNKNNLFNDSVNLSLEVKQLNKIIEISKVEEKKAYWSWIDPSGSSLTGLGLPYGVMIEISKIKTKELILQKEQLNAFTQQKANEVYQNYLASLKSYDLSLLNLDLQNKRKQLFEQKINLGLQVDFFGLLSVLQDHLTAKSKIAEAHLNYRLARARINRLLLTSSQGDKVNEKN